MKRYIKRKSTLISRNEHETGKSIEEVIRNALNNPNGIEETAPPMYTPRDSGVLAECDIRTDRQLLAIAACDKYTKSKVAKTDGIALAKGEEDNKNKVGNKSPTF